MIWLLLLMAQTSSTPSAPVTEEVSRGGTVFAKSCAIGYCHGTGGAAGRAPRIQGRSFAHGYLTKVVRDGIPGTGMPAWSGKLSDDDIKAVVAYMMSISAPAPGGVQASAQQTSGPPAGTATVPEKPMPPEVKQGRDLFFDAARGTRCGTCHAVANWGIAIGPNLVASPPKDVAAIRSVSRSEVVAARVSGGDAFPAVVVERKNPLVRLYDLTSAPPVLRTFSTGDVSTSNESSWSHGSAIRSYSDTELESVVGYLHWLASH